MKSARPTAGWQRSPSPLRWVAKIIIKVVPIDGRHVASISINDVVVTENPSKSASAIKNITCDSKVEVKFEKDASGPSDPPNADAAPDAIIGGIIAGICPLLLKRSVNTNRGD